MIHADSPPSSQNERSATRPLSTTSPSIWRLLSSSTRTPSPGEPPEQRSCKLLSFSSFLCLLFLSFYLLLSFLPFFLPLLPFFPLISFLPFFLSFFLFTPLYLFIPFIFFLPSLSFLSSPFYFLLSFLSSPFLLLSSPSFLPFFSLLPSPSFCRSLLGTIFPSPSFFCVQFRLHSACRPTAAASHLAAAVPTKHVRF